MNESCLEWHSGKKQSGLKNKHTYQKSLIFILLGDLKQNHGFLIH